MMATIGAAASMSCPKVLARTGMIAVARFARIGATKFRAFPRASPRMLATTLRVVPRD